MEKQLVSTKAYDLSVLQTSDKKHVAIVCHDQPDPDCLASAMAMKAIAESLGLSSTIYYGGEIAHTQNRVMINVLNIPIVKLDNEDESVDSIKDSISKSLIVVVDTSNFRKENCQSISSFVPKDRQPDLIIDHHSPSSGISGAYINRPYGSCSTILYEAMVERGIPIDNTLATALYLGVSTDTDDLRAEIATDEDRAAVEKLKHMVDPEIYLKIFSYPKPLGLLNLRSKAYSTISVKDNLAVANVGVINPQQRALLAELCQEILEIEAIETAVVLGVTDEGLGKDKAIAASFRSRVLAIDTKDFIQRVFGKKYGGGRKGCGAAKVPLDGPTCSAIDHLGMDEDNDAAMNRFISPLFDFYSAKIREEKEKI